MEKVFGWLSQKTSSTKNNPFQDLVYEAAKTLDPAQIQNCAITFIEFYSNLSQKELIDQPIKKECTVMLSFMIPFYVDLVNSNSESSTIFKCIEIASVFIPARSDYSDLLSKLLNALLRNRSNNPLSQSRRLLLNMLNNNSFVDYVTKDDTLVQLFTANPPDAILFEFMRNAVLKSSISSAKNYQLIISTIINSIEIVLPESVYFIGALYKKMGRCLQLETIFDFVNTKLVTLGNVLFYEDVIKVSTSSPGLVQYSFNKLCQKANRKLMKPILKFLANHGDFSASLMTLLPKLKEMSTEEQETFLSLVQKEKPQTRNSIISKLFPPWNYSIDCNVLAKYIQTYMSSEDAENYLMFILAETKVDEQCAAFEALPMFHEFFMALIQQVEDYENVENYFSKLALLACSGHECVLKSLEGLCRHFPPVTYKNILICDLDALNTLPSFAAMLERLMSEIAELRVDLLCKDFIEWTIKNKMLNCLAVLAVDGPHKIIDDCVNQLFDQCFNELSQEQLQKLAYGLLQESASTIGTIRIPSILPKLSNATFSSLFDRYVAGKYLMDNDLITIDSPILPEIGVQCLSEKIASKLIDAPAILEKVTNPAFPHQSVIQFQAKREGSYMTIGEIPLTFSFRVDAYKNPFILFSASGFDFVYNGQSLICNENNIICPIGMWHEVDISFPNDKIDVRINGQKAFYLPSRDLKSPIIIGSTKQTPGSTFYIKSRLVTNNAKKEPVSYQSGGGLLNVGYSGIAVHAPLINAVPRLLQKLLTEDDQSSFQSIFQSLINIESFDCVSLSVNDFLGFIRVILCERNQMVTSDIITSAFSFVCTNGNIDWHKFKRLFIDYRLWITCFNTMSMVIMVIAQIYQNKLVKKDEAEFTSLLHFLIDLIIYCGIHDNSLEDLVITMAKSNPFNRSTLIIHILNREPTEFVNKMIDEIPDLLGSVPFQFIPQMSQELAGKYLLEMAEICCHNESTFDQEAINKMIPLLSNFVTEQRFWISMFMLLTKVKFDSIELFNHSPIAREGMLHPIFVLLCDLYKEEDKEGRSELLFLIVDSIKSIISVSNVMISKYITDLQLLLHFGVNAKTMTSLPVSFNGFEPCRMPIEEEQTADQIIDLVDSFEMPKYESPSAQDFLLSTDLWFGLPSTPFVGACQKEISQVISRFEQSASSSDEQEDATDLQEEVRKIMESPSHMLVVEITAAAFTELSGDALSTALKHTTIFGPDVDPKLTIQLHQACIKKMLSVTPVTIETLDFLRKMVCVGWWDNQLPGLFNSVISSFEHFQGFADDEGYLARWNSLADLIKTILALSIDYSSFHFVQFAPTIFNNVLISQKSYLLFIMHVLMTDEFANNAQAQVTWLSLFGTLGSLEDSTLSSYFEGVFTNQEDIAAQIHELAIRTQYFSTISDNDAALATKLKNVCIREYDAFMAEKQEELPSLTAEVRDLRRASKETSDEYKERQVEIIRHNARKTEACLRYIEEFSFHSRFNLTSHENERSAYHLWSILPSKETTKFQLCPTVHPLSTPILYVPLSSKINASRPQEYSDYEKHMKTTKINGVDVKHSFTPPTLDAFVSMPFYETNKELHDFLFRASFRHYGKIKEFSSLVIVFGTMRVKCALAKAERGFYIITEAKSVDGKLLLKANKPNLAVVTFLDSLAYKYYGSCSLFYGHCVLFVSAKHVVNAVPRNYCYQPLAIEIWFARGYSLFLVFTSKSIRDDFEEEISHREYFPRSQSLFGPSFSNRICQIVGKPGELKKLSEEWVLGTLSSQTYLSCLNFLADRSFSNFCQYPVMPWVLPQRDMSKPMGQQSAERAETFQTTFETSDPDKHFYGSHYSSAAVVMHFLMRIQPFSNLHFELQNGFDHQDRLFSDIEQEWMSSSELSSHNVEELIPEFFLLPEALTNVNRLPIPPTSRQRSQDNVMLPESTSNPVAFVWWFRKMLDDNESLEKWINLIFGAYSRGQAAIEHKNLFYPCTYGIRSSIAGDDKAFEQMMRCFGQTPTQLFTEPHPPRNTVCFKRTPLLIDTDMVFTQFIKTESKEVKDPIIIQTKTSYAIESCSSVYAMLSHSSALSFFDGLMTWKSFTVDDLVASCFSIEKLLFCGVFPSGGMQICRSVCREDGTIIGYYPLSSCTMPHDIQISEPFTCCAVSSHHFVACEASGKTLYCFHVGTGHFIRSIQTEDTIKSIQIDDSFSCFYIFCVSSIEVFTINGTFVGKTSCDSPIISSAISCNDVIVFAATAHKDGTIRFWRADASESCVQCIKKIDSPDKEILAIEILRGGSALVSINKSNVGVVFVSRGVGKGIISNAAAARCACCLRESSKLHECQSCGLYYCDKCCTPTPGTICQQCLQQIEECNDFDF